MSHQEQPAPPVAAPRFSWGRVGSALLLVLLAAATFAGVWLFPWPVKPHPTAPSLPVKERIEAMKRIAERQAAEKRAAERRAAEGEK